MIRFGFARTLRTLLLATALASPSAIALAQMSPIGDGDGGARIVRPHTQFLSASDLALFRQAFDLCDRGQFDAARGLVAPASAQVVRDLVDWRYLTSTNSGADFQSISNFIAKHSDWGGISVLRARAEATMPAAQMDAKDVIAWFKGRDPASGEGMLKLGEAYVRAGDTAKGRAMIKRGWIRGEFSDDRLASIASQYASHLTRDDHLARLSHMLWERKGAAASAMFSYVDAGAVAMATARLRFQSSARTAEAAFAAVPGDYRNDPGLLLDRARFLRRRDRDSEARQSLIAAQRGLNGPAPSQEGWWDEHNVLARSALDEGQASTAYTIAAGHGIRHQDNLADFAEGEFLAGWIALQFLNKPEKALEHFKRLRSGVTAPISVARAHYWSGRALQKMGKGGDAKAEYQAASVFPLTYYGQLAMAEVNPRGRFQVPATPKAGSREDFRNRSAVQAMLALADLGEDRRLRSFALTLAEVLNTPDEFSHLVATVREMGQPALAVRVAKRGLQRNISVYDLAYPTIGLPAYAGQGAAPEAAFVLGLIRQESEFDPGAISSANARGLMQMIHGTAKMTATRHGLPYGGRDSLLQPITNMRLGMAHMGDLLSDYAGSYIMTAAAYNAGGGRVNEWVGRFGDPRATGADIIDWVERIPFSETRNYVQRVLENAQVYRAILSGRETQVALGNDLKRGAYTSLASVSQFTGQPPAGTQPVPDVASVAAAGTASIQAAIGANPVGMTAAPATPQIAMMAPVVEEDEKPGATPILKPKTQAPEKAVKKGKGKKPKAVATKSKKKSGAAAVRACRPGKDKNCRKRPS